MARRQMVEERRKMAGVEVQEKLRKLQGRSRNDVVSDRVRGASSPLGKRKVEGGKR
jgi:hypothetical protein